MRQVCKALHTQPGRHTPCQAQAPSGVLPPAPAFPCACNDIPGHLLPVCALSLHLLQHSSSRRPPVHPLPRLRPLFLGQLLHSPLYLVTALSPPLDRALLQVGSSAFHPSSSRNYPHPWQGADASDMHPYALERALSDVLKGLACMGAARSSLLQSPTDNDTKLT